MHQRAVLSLQSNRPVMCWHRYWRTSCLGTEKRRRLRDSENGNGLQIYVSVLLREAEIVDDSHQQMSPCLTVNKSSFFIRKDENKHDKQKCPHEFLSTVLQKLQAIREGHVHRPSLVIH